VELASDQPCIVIAPPRAQVAVGDDVRVYVSPDDVYLFENSEAGRNMASRDVTE
jgi:hypothetical protein